MQTLKTAAVVVLLLVVFYGAYEMLNRPPDDPPEGAKQYADMPFDPPEIQFGELDDGGTSEQIATAPQGTGSGDLASPAPPAAAPPFSGDFAAVPPLSPPDSRLPGDSGSHLSVDPPTSPSAAASPTTNQPDSSAYVPEPPGSRVQGNPYVTQDIVTKPSDGSPSSRAEQLGALGYKHHLKLAKAEIRDGKYLDALRKLSVFYKSPDLTAQEQRELLDLLDPLAGQVIYSQEHLVSSAYKVRRNERLSDIAQQYNVPTELLQKINGIKNPDVLIPGMELKVVPGPFEAEVDLQGRELTLFLDGLYAGRFPISVGQDPQPVDGKFTVQDKRVDRPYFTREGRTIPADSPNNPFGKVWLDLGQEVCIHGSPLQGTSSQRGCIGLSPQDANDVYSILSVGSTVRILR